ncbi:hypothetical protein SCH01S_01_00440 [Sphingomonas changbaiensis NBRC 104936]|uniref:Sortilin N-terminal domain-containing protein n=1 Tax=Sphingomonas changbaiensis NBRC 104936 TaxID=1219043 RepID=A0A0E9MKE7_9SPHN|nr:glycosyl hydrolase [Sphingomonas changbaiensis]GAO37881.1 hypothetical protein SCH01S_01_00440 [Sphingomonas changbaiensis NBRC 104936]
MRGTKIWFGCVSVLALIAGPALAADTDKPAATKAEAAKPVTGDEAFFTGLKWRNIGPDRGGRSIAVAGSASRPNEYYFGAVGGGLWKTTDGGTTWKPVTDGQLDNAAVGGVAVCEANPDVVYLTTGETELRGNIMAGDGVWKSTDAGKTWHKIGLTDVHNFSRVRVHPKDCDTAYVGGFGPYGTESEARGVYKTTDGGKGWNKVLYRDARTGAVDISIDPNHPDTVYAALWEAWRKPWGMSSGGPGSGLFKSTDGGATWTELTRAPGMPQSGPIGKIGVSVSPVDGQRVYAIVEHADGGVFVSNDGGAHWTRTNESRDLRQRAFYYSRIFADPKIKDRVYVLNVQFFRSDDGGKTFKTKIKVPHGDNHDLWIAGNDNQRMIQGNDGGAIVSVNGGTSWTAEDFPTAQIYRVTISHHFPYFACGAQQDNTTICVPSRDWKFVNSLGGQYGFEVGGGESGYIANDPKNPNVFYAGSYGGMLDRFDYSTGQTRRINVHPDNPMGYSASDIAERFQWTYPIVFDPKDPQTLYVASQHVWRTRNEGQSWERISPDLTRHDPSTLGPSGGPITLDQTGVETYGTVFALAPSRLEKGVIWAGSDDGMVHITRDSGASWADVTPAGLPPYLKITTIEDSPHKPGTAYLTGHRYLLGDFKPYVLKTSDYGRSWTSIAKGIPDDEVARSIREDTVRPGLLYLGTERGVWVSLDDGDHWHKLQRNLPAVQVADLAVTDHDLVIGTHGRSFWVMDNIDVLRQVRPGDDKQLKLFAPAPAVRDVDAGVAIDYFLPKEPKKLTLDILGPDGKLVQSFAGSLKEEKPKSEGGGDDEDDNGPKPVPTAAMKQGLNRFTWNMHYPGFTEFPGMIMWTSRNRGIMAVPGRYTARLTVDGKAQEQSFEIRSDPRAKANPADLQRRFDFASRVSARVSEANQAVLLIRGIKQQTDADAKKATDPAVKAALAAFDTKLSAIEGRIYQTRNRSRQDPLNYPIMLNDKLAGLIGTVESADAPPTEQSERVFADLSGQLDTQLNALKQLLDSDLPTLNAQLKHAGLQPVERKALPAQPAGTAKDSGGEEAEEEEGE